MEFHALRRCCLRSGLCPRSGCLLSGRTAGSISAGRGRARRERQAARSLAEGAGCREMRVGPLGRWAAGPLGRWAAGPLGRWAAGPLGRWAAGPLGRWAAGPLGRWAAGPLGRWAAGPLGRWAAGPLGRWAHYTTSTPMSSALSPRPRRQAGQDHTFCHKREVFYSKKI